MLFVAADTEINKIATISEALVNDCLTSGVVENLRAIVADEIKINSDVYKSGPHSRIVTPLRESREVL